MHVCTCVYMCVHARSQGGSVGSNDPPPPPPPQRVKVRLWEYSPGSPTPSGTGSVRVVSVGAVALN